VGKSEHLTSTSGSIRRGNGTGPNKPLGALHRFAGNSFLGPLTEKEIMKRTIMSTVTALAGMSLATVAAIAPAMAASPDAGLFGSMDPTYDGVYRQSIAILALNPLNKVPVQSITWLKSQQCLDGSFEAYRKSIRTACSVPDPAKFTGADSNATSLAAMALRAVKETSSANKAIAALIATQNKDGGWGYTLGGASDVNSTGLTLAALNGAPKSAAVKAAGNRARGYLGAVQVPCTGTGTFGLPYQANGPVDLLASGQGLLGLAGTLPFAKPTSFASVNTTNCKSPAINKVATYLSKQLIATQGALPSAMDPKQFDWNSTTNAVLALSSAKLAKPAIDAGVAALQKNVTSYIGTGDKFKAAADGGLILVAQATGLNPSAFGSKKTDLVAQLLNSVTK
jgi:hypothetical protein